MRFLRFCAISRSEDLYNGDFYSNRNRYNSTTVAMSKFFIAVAGVVTVLNLALLIVSQSTAYIKAGVTAAGVTIAVAELDIWDEVDTANDAYLGVDNYDDKMNACRALGILASVFEGALIVSLVLILVKPKEFLKNSAGVRAAILVCSLLVLIFAMIFFCNTSFSKE